jgi:hypothetical protein
MVPTILDRIDMSDYLFAQPSFLTGMGRVLDLGGVFDDYNTSETEAEAESKAMLSDWAAVGQDLADAMGTVSERAQ